MADNSPFNLFLLFTLIFLMNSSVAALTCQLLPSIKDKILTDPNSLNAAAIDYGNIIHNQPAAVLAPTSFDDMVTLVSSSYNCHTPFGISVRGNGHSVDGQDMVTNGVVIDMKRYRESGGCGIKVSKSPLYADIGGEQLWIDVLNVTTQQGYSPVSWTDFLFLTVGGTLSNAGIGGQSFRFGPQINNVYELDVVTGKGELATCSPQLNPDLFYAVLGGLGQFGIITRARIALGPAYNRVKWLRMLFSNFDDFTRAQEDIISKNGPDAVSYLEGQILLDNGTPNTWETIFFPEADRPKINAFVKQYGIVYVVEVANFYVTSAKRNQESMKLRRLIKELNAVPEYQYVTDVPYYEFLARVPVENVKTTSHPWFNLFIPKSRINDFNTGVLREIVLKNNITIGPVLFYPMNKNKWNEKMSAMIPEEDVFYTLGLLYSTAPNAHQPFLDQNGAILAYCANAGIEIKRYLMTCNSKNDWINHFGSTWAAFEKAKHQFDPKFMLSPGQRIFI